MTTPIKALRDLLELFDGIDGGEHDDDPVIVRARCALTIAENQTAARLVEAFAAEAREHGIAADLDPKETAILAEAFRGAVASSGQAPETPLPPLTIEFHYDDGDVGVHPVEPGDPYVTALWRQFSRSVRHVPDRIVISQGED